jgi:hypothetical protein
MLSPQYPQQPVRLSHIQEQHMASPGDRLTGRLSSRALLRDIPCAAAVVHGGLWSISDQNTMRARIAANPRSDSDVTGGSGCDG